MLFGKCNLRGVKMKILKSLINKYRIKQFQKQQIKRLTKMRGVLLKSIYYDKLQQQQKK